MEGSCVGPEFVVAENELKTLVATAMRTVSVLPETGGDALGALLIAADRFGHYSHGLNRLHIYVEDVRDGSVDPKGAPSVLRRKGGTAWVDGGNALGVVVGEFCSDLAAELAREFGIGWVVARRSNHFGICRFYADRIAKQGLVGMAVTNSSPIMFPCRSAEIGLGTNPICVVANAARADDCFALDMASTTVALGKVEIAERRGCESLPGSWGADARGRPTSDPAKILHEGGGLLPLGGTEENRSFKGSGLSMMGELFCGILAGSGFGKSIRMWGDSDKIADLGQCFVALDPACFAPGFPARLQRFLDETRALEPLEPEKPVLVPGDPERSHADRCSKAGGVIYGRAQIEHLNVLARQFGLPDLKSTKLD